MSHYDELGIDRDAAPEEIRRAFRKKASKDHPDKGGDPEAFRRARRAYEVLISPAKRERYDRGEPDETTVPEDPEARARHELVAFVLKVIEESERPEAVDIISVVVRGIEAGLGGIEKQIKALTRQATKYRSVRKRLRRKTKEPDFVGEALEARARGCETKIEEAKRAIEEGKLMLRLARTFEFEAAPQQADDTTMTYQSVFDRYQYHGAGGSGGGRGGR